MNENNIIYRLNELLKDRHKIFLKKIAKKSPQLLRKNPQFTRLAHRIFTESAIENFKTYFVDFVKEEDEIIPLNLMLEYVSSDIEDILDSVLAGSKYFSIFNVNLDIKEMTFEFQIGSKESNPSVLEIDFTRLMNSYAFRKLKNYFIATFNKGIVMYTQLRRFNNYEIIDNLNKFPNTKILLSARVNIITGRLENEDRV